MRDDLEPLPPPPPLRVRVGLSVVIWLVLGLLNAAQHMVAYRSKGMEALSWGESLQAGLTWAFGWAVLTPLIYSVVRAVHPSSVRLKRTLGWMAATSMVAAVVHPLLHMAADIAHAAITGAELEVMEHTKVVYVTGTWPNLMTGIMVCGLMATLVLVQASQQRLLAAARLEAALGEARLEALRLQLNPHFLFNTLNSISALILVNPDAAERMVARLGDLLRVTLERQEEAEVSLSRELEVLELYVSIERIRFGDRLTVTVEVAAGLGAARVPGFVLQPLVENAIQHGVGSRAGPGVVRVRGERDGEALVLTVEDDGVGLGGRAPEDMARGIGLANTRQRLQHMYGAQQSLTLEDAAGGGLVVRLRIPLRLGEGEAA